MNIVNIHDAKAHFSEYVSAVESGETVIIARRNKPVAKLVPITATDLNPEKKTRTLGLAKGLITLHPTFFDPLSADELAEWERPLISAHEPDTTPDPKP